MNRSLLALTALLLIVPTAAALADEGPTTPEAEAPPPGLALDGEDLTDEVPATYLDEDFQTLDGWETQHPDPVQRTTWRIAPAGQDGDPAALLSGGDGLPGGFHVSLASEPVDLTPVPSIGDDTGSAVEKTEGLDATGDANEAARTAAASAEIFSFTDFADDEDAVTTGSVHVPEGPAYLTLQHRFAFNDTRNAEDQALAGFTVEAREPGGTWTTVEPTMVAKPARGAGSPAIQEASVGFAFDEEAFFEAFTDPTLGFDGDSLDPCQPFDVAGAYATYLLGAGASNCTAEPFTVPGSEGGGDPLLTLGDAVSLRPVGDAANSSYPALPEAHVAPLDAIGYTGASEDRDEDGRPDVVGWVFDLSPWAGEELKLRFRAAAAPGVATEDGLWAIDHVQVRGGSHAADLALDVTRPDRDDLAAPGEAFPVTFQVQNQGLVEQSGPHAIEVEVRDHQGELVRQTTVEAEGTLGFLDTAEATLDLAATREQAPLQIDARLQPGHPDAEPRNDEDHARLPVGVDRSVEIDVQPATPRVEPGEPVQVTVTVENTGNVPIEDALRVSPHGHDRTLTDAAGPPLSPPQVEPLELDRSPARHPLGTAEASQQASFTFTIDEARPVQLHASFAEAAATQGLGVGTPTPALLSAAVEDVEAGPPSFELHTDAGTWRAWADSDVQAGPATIEPGDVNGSAWVPLAHESTLVRPAGGEHLVDGFQETPRLGYDGEGICTPLVVVCVPNPTSEPRVGTPLVLESPRGTQRVYAMSHEVALHDAREAQLSLLSSLVPPDDERGVAEARVYVATEHEVGDLWEQVQRRCPDQATHQTEQVCQLTNIVAVDETADRLVESVFALEENVRCSLPYALGDDVGDPVTDTTCPSSGSGEARDCFRTGGITQASGEVCLADGFSQLEALAPMLAGTLVHRETTPHPWEQTTIDLDPWAGDNVTVGIVYVAESDEATETYDVEPYGQVGPLDVRALLSGPSFDPLSGTIGYEAPGRAQGAYLVDRVTVDTDQGRKLAPEDTARKAEQIVNAAQNREPGEAQPGWSTVGYEHRTGLGDRRTPLRTSAQILTGDGFTPAEDADPSQGFDLGVRDGGQRGVELYPRRLHQFVEENAHFAAEQSPGDLEAPADDPAVTVLASPTVDLAGTEDPVLRFRQAFDLATSIGPQGVVEALNHTGVAAALGLPSNTTQRDECALGERNPRLPEEADVTLEGMRCLLEEKRSRGNPSFDVQVATLNASVSQPDVAAGLFVQARTVHEDGSLSEPELVRPLDGYRYPIGDAGGFAPTLDYTVRSPDAFPGYATDQDWQGPFQSGLMEQATYTETPRTAYAGTPAWAGDSDVDGDGEADWVTSQLDLSAFEGQQIELQFVLVARQNQEVPDPITGSEGTILSQQPWSIDAFEVLERDDEGQLALEELDWPDPNRPLAAPGEELPVRFDVTTPTGLEAPIHGKAQLVDDEGCLRAEATNVTDPGQLAPGEEATLETSFPAEDVDGTTPWTLRLAADAGQPPAAPVFATVEMRPSPGVERAPADGVLRAPPNATIRAAVEDPDCSPSPSVVTVEAPRGEPNVTVHDLTDDEVELAVEEDGLAGDVDHPVPAEKRALAIVEGTDGHADTWARTLLHEGPSPTVEVGVDERVAAGLPVEVELSPSADLTEADLWTVDPVHEDVELAWSGRLDALDATSVTVSFDEGPVILVATGTTPDGEVAIGTASAVARPGQPAGDPLAQDDRTRLSLVATETTDLSLEDVTVAPEHGLETDGREVTVPVRNPGTLPQRNVTVDLLADGDLVTSWTTNLTAGERATFRVSDYQVGQPTVLLEGRASSGSLEASAVAVAHALVDLGEASFTDPGPGWRVDNGTARFEDPDTGEAPRDTVGSLGLDTGPLTRLNGFVARLNHSLAMEEGFDAGQAQVRVGEQAVALASPDAQRLNPLSPLQGSGLTGQIEGPTRMSLDAETHQIQEETIRDQTAVDAFGEGLFDQTGVPAEGYADCEGRTFADEDPARAIETGCAWSQPLVPVPEPALQDGVFHLQPAAFLSSEDGWTVEVPDTDERYEFRPEEATSYVFLEAGSGLVTAAQEEDRLRIAFDEARMLDPLAGSLHDPLSVEVCARFMEAGEDGIAARRCSGLNHEAPDDQLGEREWGRTILTIGDVPEGPFDVVRIELSLEQDRDADPGTGLMGPQQSATDAYRLDRPVKGWFVGPVTAEAGDTAQTWVPDEAALATTDPNTGLTASELDGADRLDWPTPEGPVEQSAALALTEVEVTDQGGSGQQTFEVSTVEGIEEDERPFFDLPILPCPWHEAGSCEWRELIDAYASAGWNIDDPARLAASTAPYAMNLTCTTPDALDATQIGATRGCATSADLPGTGVQALNTTTIDLGTSDTCEVSEVGPPVLWRTRCLHLRRGTVDLEGEFGEEDPEGTSLKVTNTHVAEDEPVPLRSRGHSVDVRFVTTADLRHVAAEGDAWATPALEEIDDQTGNLDLPLPVRAEARVLGAETWQPVPTCESRQGHDCFTTWMPAEDVRHVDLSRFTGNHVELALRLQIPHPMLLDGEHGATTGDEATAALHDVSVDADYLRLVDADLALEAGTDISREDAGWTVHDVQLFGSPIGANVGTDALDSKALITDPDHRDGQLHVHANPRADRDVYMSVPANLTVFNQGTDTQKLPLAAALEAREGDLDPWIDSTTQAWTQEEGIDAPGNCEATIERTDPAAAYEDQVELAPGEVKEIGVRVNFVPESADGRLDPDNETTSTREVLAECFPGQFDEDPTDPDVDDVERELDFRVDVGLAGAPEDDYVRSDDRFTQTLRPNPFLEHREADGHHRPRVSLGELELDPTRPAENGTVEASLDVGLVDRTSRGLGLDLQLVDPVSDEVLLELRSVDAERPVTTLEPYRNATLSWELDGVPANATLVRAHAQIVHESRTLEDRAHGWLAPGAASEHVDRHEAEELATAGDAELQQQGNETVAHAERDDGDAPPFPFGDSGEEGDALAAAIGTDWIHLDASPPPLVSVRADWSFDGEVWADAGDHGGSRDQVLDGWTVQVCHVEGEPQDGDCPISTNADGNSGTGRWAWRTVDVVHGPADTLAGAPNPEDLDASCDEEFRLQDPGSQNQGDDAVCSEIASDWANMHEGDDVVTSAPSTPTGERWRTVTGAATACSVELDPYVDEPGCPAWNTTDRHRALRLRVVTFSSDDTTNATLTVDDVTVTPVGVAGELAVAEAPVPAGVPKAFPFQVERLGSVGLTADAEATAADGQARVEPDPLTPDPGEPARLIVEREGAQSPIETRLDPRPDLSPATRAWATVTSPS